MNPIIVDINVDKPSDSEIQKMWDEVEFEVLNNRFEFVDLLKKHIGGKLNFRGFQVKENKTFDWFCSRGMLSDINFEERFLLSKKVISTFDLIEDDDFNYATTIDKKPSKLEWKSPFTIDGELAALLFHGGVYGSTINKDPKQVKDLAQAFCKELFNENYHNTAVWFYKNGGAWNSWYWDFYIDWTYLIICLKSRTIWLLAFTDTD